ncbi:MAG: response regulator transcription factor [Spirochaetia bacterium]|jgi:DNA-binding response OmpR family regulator
MTRAVRRVLIVDDEPKIAEVVSSYLRKAGFEPLSADTGAHALKLFEEAAPALVILDLMLPDLSGEEVCRRLRARSRVPIIMLTAKVEDADAVRGLSLGADDYVTKPFSPRQLVARVEAVLRRSAGESAILAERLSFCGDDLAIDPRTNIVRKAGVQVPLTPRELHLLRILMANPGRIFSRDELIDRVFGDDYRGYDRTVDAHMKNLRRKIETDPGNPRYIRTVHGLGYSFCGDGEG